MNMFRPLLLDSSRKPALTAPQLTPAIALLFAISLLMPGAALARGWIGVSVQDIDPSLREAMALPQTGGALVSDVVPDGPADRAGIRARDVILRVEGTPVEDSGGLIAALREMSPGQAIEATILRGDEQLSRKIVLAGRPDDAGAGRRVPAPIERLKDLPRLLERPKEGGLLGVQVHPLDEHLAPYFKVRGEKGLLVLSVTPDSPADRSGLLPGDVLLRFNGEPVSQPQELRQQVARLDPGQEWRSDGIREGREREFRGSMDSPPQRSMERRLRRPTIPIGPDRENGSISGRQEVKRLERELQRLRERVRQLERRIERKFDR